MNRLAAIAKILSLLSVLIGVSGMAGWIFDREILASLYPGFIPMAPSTGLVFAMLGSATWFFTTKPTTIGLVYAQVVGAGVMAYAIWVLSGILSGHDWGLDAFIVPQAEGFGAVKKARMSPITATNFLLDGAALCFMVRRLRGRGHWPAMSGALALTSLGITFTVLLGYLFGSPLLYGGTTIPMALTTALAFLCLDSALIFAGGDRQFPLRYVTGQSTSALLLRWFLPIVVTGSVVSQLITGRLDTFNDINLAFVAAMTVLVTTLCMIIIVMLLSKRLGEVIDSAEGQRDLVQDRMLQQAKMAALGEMAGTIAHELNNPLTIVDGRTRQMQVRLERGEVDQAAMRVYCDTIAETTLRSIKIINALTAIARKTDRDPPITSSLRKIIDETLTLCSSRSKYAGVSITVDCYEGLDIDCRPGEIAQVLLNLLNNAFDAVDAASAKWIKVSASLKDGWVDLVVTDSGTGIPQDLREKIMQPFFTTKAYSKGTGLGLSISKGIIEGHGGRLTLDNESSNTCFKVRLPRAFAQAGQGG